MAPQPVPAMPRSPATPLVHLIHHGLPEYNVHIAAQAIWKFSNLRKEAGF
jgi:hypothetical protein